MLLLSISSLVNINCHEQELYLSMPPIHKTHFVHEFFCSFTPVMGIFDEIVVIASENHEDVSVCICIRYQNLIHECFFNVLTLSGGTQHMRVCHSRYYDQMLWASRRFVVFIFILIQSSGPTQLFSKCTNSMRRISQAPSLPKKQSTSMDPDRELKAHQQTPRASRPLSDAR